MAPVTEGEKSLYTDIDFDIAGYCDDAGVKETIYKTKEELLQHRWRFPSLSLHGIQVSFTYACVIL